MARHALPGTTRAEILSAEGSVNNIAYNASFREWFANQVSAFLTTNKVATTAVDRFFKGIADIWKRLWEAHTGRQGPVAEIDAWMRKHGDFETEAGKEPAAPRPMMGRAAEDTIHWDKGPLADTIHGKLSNELHKLDRKNDAYKREALKAVRALPKEAQALKEKFFSSSSRERSRPSRPKSAIFSTRR